jgi:hypothetical protein
MAYKSIIIPTLLALLLVVAACESKQGRFPGEMTDEEWENQPTLEDIICDSIAEMEDISVECAALCNDLNNDIRDLSMVNSPTALISAKKDHQTLMVNVTRSAKEFKEHERKILHNYCEQAVDTYDNVCRRFEVPSTGVIANLEQLSHDLDQVRSKQDFEEYKDHHYGVMQTLDDIHLCIERRSNDIAKVKRLAQALKAKYQEKDRTFGDK